MDDLENWRWIWIVAATGFVVGEIAMPGTFFLLSFAVGAAAAAVVAFANGSLLVQWIAFVAGSAAALALLVPLGRRLDARQQQASVGATRFEGRSATVLVDIPAGTQETGLVRLDREEWRAETADGVAVPAGSVVRVLRVEGTRLVVSSDPIGRTVLPEVPQEGDQDRGLNRPGAPGAA
jgi:inner membrane protein